MNNSLKYFLFAITLIIVDQVLKLWMHFVVLPQHFGNIDLIPGIFKLHYVTNKGMAFGMELGGEYGKLALTLFRLVAMFGIGWYLNFQATKTPNNGLLWAIAAILAGAMGNVLDSTFYGVLINGNAPTEAPYPWFHGQVIDMFYFYFLDGFWPEWVPIVGGTYHSTPIFNFADACIFLGVVSILFFQKRFLEMKPMDNDFVMHMTENESILETGEHKSSQNQDNSEGNS
ncbi:MAG: lipoprotein signal peptidase [Cytophagaceae bacterium]|nr:lipoprotein signal peptidase [Cytophagaceae bacterium]MBK9509612.1 lipoprotein signal peptidase [Cytophagaceae bacterium]MBK9936193.1 lipoprotein signal peptidase [Cytophagaceae bacterium]MBL0303918.1 lipoprotein signal peptidase [Cytophagaceae bacterium]MBL0326731.1 lipoprotein signal peptidase [Cytophagaceae bacterium]